MTIPDLALDVYEHVLNSTESFAEDHIGEDLAYLMGAILKGSQCEWSAGRPILKVLAEKYPDGHRVWQHVCVDNES